MTQNIYDNPEFFANCACLGRSVAGLDGAPEWPALRALLPELRGARVLDLGCGFGWFCRFAAEQGAARVPGIDVSGRMLERARAMTSHDTVSYRRADAETLDLPEASFDLAYSALALHYVVNLDALLATLHRALVPGGSFVVSVEHPIYTAPRRPGRSVDAEGRKTWPIDGYRTEGPRRTDWLARGVIKQHRTIGTHVRMLLRAGFTLTHLEEWGPTETQIAARPELAEERERPMFLLLAARR